MLDSLFSTALAGAMSSFALDRRTRIVNKLRELETASAIAEEQGDTARYRELWFEIDKWRGLLDER